jgi:hypothetical protein
MTFSVNQGQDINLGFLRVFVAKDAFDLEIEQDGVGRTFEQGQGDLEAIRDLVHQQKLETQIAVWDVITLPIVQTRVSSRSKA